VPSACESERGEKALLFMGFWFFFYNADVAALATLSKPIYCYTCANKATTSQQPRRSSYIRKRLRYV